VIPVVDSSPRRFRFGVQRNTAASRAEWVETARRAEALGFDVLAVSDHFRPQLAPFAALAVAASVTEHLRLATQVIDNDFRHPAVLAKEAATLDVLSDGRFELGLGAGWDSSDYDLIGLPFDQPAVRVARLEESVQIIRALFGEAPVTFAGKHYQVTGLEGHPRPVERRGPPIFIGGSRRRVLSIAARYADIVGVHVSLGERGAGSGDAATLTEAATIERLGWIRDAAGSRLRELELQVLVYLVGLDRTTGSVAAEAREKFGFGPDEVRSSLHILAGSVDGIVECLEERRARFGISYVAVNWRDIDAMAKVIRRLK